MTKPKKRRLRKEFQFILPFSLIIVGFFLIRTFSFSEPAVYNKVEHEAQKLEYKALFRTEKITETASMFIVGDALVQIECIDQSRTGEDTYDWSYLMDGTANAAADYDIAFYNQETILGGDYLGITAYPHFNCPQSFGDYMISKGFNLVSTANNHSLDKDEEGIENSEAFWKAKTGVVEAGLNTSESEREEIDVHEVNGITYAFTAWTYNTNGYETSPGHEYMVNTYRGHEQEMLDWVSRAKEKADIVIVSMHWGDDYTDEPNDEQMQLARQLSDAGADIIIGSHPHNIQPVQWINDRTICFYSMGNLVNSQNVVSDTTWEDVNTGMAASLVIEKTIDVDDTATVAIKDVKTDLLFTSYTGSFENIHSVFYKDIDPAVFPDKDAFYQKMANEVIRRYDSSITVGF